jgi:ABC-2 type transport system ATP-binding protein
MKRSGKETLLGVEHLHKRYGRTIALKDVSFAVKRGEIVGVVGPDGAGKTTLLRAIAGILQPDSGEIGRFAADGSPLSTGDLGYMPQHFSLYGNFSVDENLLFRSRLFELDNDAERRRNFLLEMTGLAGFRDRAAIHLSGGMKQKLSLAAALLHNPPLLILDEPSTGVDPLSRRDIWQIIYRLNREGTTVIMSTPYMDEAELCTRVLLLYEGRLVKEGTPRDITGSAPWSVIRIEGAGRSVRARLFELPEVRRVTAFGDSVHVVVKEPARGIEAIRSALSGEAQGNLEAEIVEPSLEDVFIDLLEEGKSWKM